MKTNPRPDKAELEFLTLAYERFYDIFEEVMDDSFWETDEWYRFSIIKEGFAVYAELLNYEPLQWAIENIRKSRPPMEAEVGSELFGVIRNIITHFPFFDSWDDVWVNQSIVNWRKGTSSIDRFMRKYSGHKPMKYRYWETNKKKRTYLSVNFPETYDDDTRIYLKDLIAEKDGVKFSFILMEQVLDTQVEKIDAQ